MSDDPSLSAELLFNMCSVCRFDRTGYVCVNGVTFENARRAVQAAFTARDYDLALDILQQCGLRQKMCIRCTQHVPMKTVVSPPVEIVGNARWWWHLCEECARITHTEYRNEAERQRIARALTP